MQPVIDACDLRVVEHVARRWSSGGRCGSHDRDLRLPARAAAAATADVLRRHSAVAGGNDHGRPPGWPTYPAATMSAGDGCRASPMPARPSCADAVWDVACDAVSSAGPAAPIGMRARAARIGRRAASAVGAGDKIQRLAARAASSPRYAQERPRWPAMAFLHIPAESAARQTSAAERPVRSAPRKRSRYGRCLESE